MRKGFNQYQTAEYLALYKPKKQDVSTKPKMWTLTFNGFNVPECIGKPYPICMTIKKRMIQEGKYYKNFKIIPSK